jgi:hypothetical protein
MVTYIELVVLSLVVYIGLWVASGKAGIEMRDRMGAMLLSIGITGIWLTAAVALGLLCFFCAQPDRFPRIPLVLLAFSVVGLGVFLARLTHRVLGAIPAGLIAFQTFRIIGINFLVRYSEGQLPALFAIPIGVGDVLIGLAAPFVAYWYHKQKPSYRTVAIWFNIVGVLDIAFSGTVVVLSQSSTIQVLHLTPSTDLVTQFPIILEAVYGMPVVVFVHLFSLYYVWKHTGQSTARAAG